jgi:transposase
MARRRYSEGDILQLLLNIKVYTHGVMDVVDACPKTGASEKTYYGWHKKFGGMRRPQLSEIKSLQKEGDQLKKILAELELNNLTLKESLNYLKPKVSRGINKVMPVFMHGKTQHIRAMHLQRVWRCLLKTTAQKNST